MLGTTTKALLGLAFGCLASAAHGQDAQLRGTTHEEPAQLVDDFITALDAHAKGLESGPRTAGVKLWMDGLKERGIDPAYVAKRLRKARSAAGFTNADPFEKYRTIQVEELEDTPQTLEAAMPPVALHAFRFDVEEDYDDTTNDDIYAYFITTHDDKVWGKVTDIYYGLDEGDSFFFNPKDRGLFGPTGDKLVPVNHTLIDFGIVESDGRDIQQLKKLSDAIVDLALVALSVYNPEAGAAAAQARTEVQNLLHLLVEMDGDDRLVTDTLRFTPDSMLSQLSGSSYKEFDRFYERSTTWTAFAYRIHFRLIQ